MSLTPGHALIPDDYAAYIMHAANIVEGRPYAEIKFVPNPDAMWISPPEGYPPIYPLMLAPVYKFFGVNFRAMKVVSVACFVIFLIVFLRLTDPICHAPAKSACCWKSRFILSSGSMGITFFPRCRT